MENNRLGYFEFETLDFIFEDALGWLITKFGDNSVELNKLNYTRKPSPLKRLIHKHGLKFSWSTDPTTLDWFYHGQWAEYDSRANTIYLGCSKKETLRFALECLFHEYRHSQQSMALYAYYNLRVSYQNHPLEKEADDFASKWVPVYVQERLAKMDSYTPVGISKK